MKNLFIGITGPWNSIVQQQYFTWVYIIIMATEFLKISRKVLNLLKKQVISQYLSKYKEVIEYHGIALDEAHRADKNNDGRNIKYPLIEWQMTEKQALEYCYSKGFDWNGLYEKFDRVSCYLCPLQRLGELKVIYKDYPHLWQKMKELDFRSIRQFGRKFRSDYSIQELEERFCREDAQNEVR